MAATALVGVTTGVIKPLLSKLSKLLEEEHVKLKGARKQIKFLIDELSAMNATLQMLADAEQLNPEMRDWREKLRELAYDLEDCIDAFMSRVDHEHDAPTYFERFFRKLKKIKARHEISNEIEDLKTRTIEASERHKRYNNVIQPACSSSTSCIYPQSGSRFAIDPRLPALYEEVDKLVGIGSPKKRIIELLTLETKGSSTELKVVTVTGCGGLGKTTLASQVYHTIRSQFSCSAFVSVSRNPNMRKILRDIAKGVGTTDYTLEDDEQQLINKLRDHLQDKRYFVVIDDVWDAKAWETIKLALLSNSLGSRIVATTRSLTVASRCSSQGGYVYQMEPLSFDDSKRLFFKRAFGSENSNFPYLGDVPDGILRKCGGLPLAIITISSLLADRQVKAEWDRVLDGIGSGLANNPNAETMTNILSFSYFDLSHHLKTCLLYLSVFPEDYKIEKQCLINRWIAEGFVQKEQGCSAFETGECYFTDLINTSLIQPADVEYGQAKACRVHDIILDYIKCKASEENFVTVLGTGEHENMSTYKIRRLCINNSNKEKVSIFSSPNLSHVRSLTIFGYNLQTSLLPSTTLRVLDLGNCWDLKETDLSSLEKLLHLKYLRLCATSATRILRKIGELHFLETLDMRGTGVVELPWAITKLQRLAHLYVDCYTAFPDGLIEQMHGLEELRQYGVGSYEQIKSLREFSKLSKLRTLEMKWSFFWLHGSDGIKQAEDFQSCVGDIISSCNICNLYIIDETVGYYPLLLDSWNPAATCSLQKLILNECYIYKVPNWMCFLGNLGVLELYIICLRLEDVEILGAMPNLLYLELGTVGGTNGRILVPGNNGFSSLKYFSLFVFACGTTIKFEEGSMPRVEHLCLGFYVHMMECMNGAFDLGIHHLTALNKVKVIITGNCINDINYDPEEDADDGTVKCVASAIKIAIKTLPNRPTIIFQKRTSDDCEHFEFILRRINQAYGTLIEWLKIWQIKENHEEEVTAGEIEQETYERSPLRVVDETDEEDEEEEEEWQDDNGSSYYKSV